MIRYIAPMEIRIRPGRISREAMLLMLLANPLLADPGKPVAGKPRK
jgi:hypothetical protein